MRLSASIACLGLALLGVVAHRSAIGAQGPRPGSPAAPTSARPEELFEKIYPVFVHPRCANCHGIVVEEGGQPDTASPDSHPADPANDPKPGRDECDECHSQPKEVADAGWTLAPLHLRWAGMDKDTLCVVQASEARKRNRQAGGSGRGTTGSYMFHLVEDPFITQAFTGEAGGQRATHPLPTPVPARDPFIAAAQEWIDAGAPCRLSGVITQEETMGDNYSFDGPGGMRITVETSANRRVDVARKVDGTATAKATGSGTETVTSVMVTPECTVTSKTFKQWQIVEPPEEPKVDVRTSVGDGSYQISVTIPAIKTVETGRDSQTNTCGGPPIDDPRDPINLTWRPWTISLNCRTRYPDGEMVCLPTEPPQVSMANGIIHRTIVDSSPTNDRAWLSISPQGVGKMDQASPTSVPIQLKTAWYFLFSQ
jgi:hypothetical protein